MENNKDNSMEDNKITKEDLLNSDEFNKAIDAAANLKKEIVTSCKDRNRNNFDRLYDVMVRSNPDIEEILSKKNRNRTDVDKEKLKEFKKDVSQTYKQVCDLIVPEILEDGEQSKFQKLVSKITRVVKMMNYIGHNEIENEFKRAGITLQYEKLDENQVFQNETVKQTVFDVFRNGKEIKEEINNNTDQIKEGIYTQSVPLELQYDKQSNPTGFKSSDFSKLVDIQAKVLMAATKEQKDKLGDQITDMASDYVFQNRKNDMMNKKMMDLIPQD